MKQNALIQLLQSRYNKNYLFNSLLLITMLTTTQLANNRIMKIENLFDDDDCQSGGYKKHPYGRMKVLYEGFILITIGPNYFCFLITFLTFCLVSWVTVSFVNSTADNCALENGTQLVCIGQCVSYLVVALSNPGVVTESSENLPASQTKQCHYCQMVVPRDTKHCSECEVCIANHDHHCPWTSKCIGGGNIMQFYIFLVMTGLFLVYLLIIVTGSVGMGSDGLETVAMPQ